MNIMTETKRFGIWIDDGLYNIICDRISLIPILILAAATGVYGIAILRVFLNV